ncbi:Ribosomal RNA small subunit methyltransferase H [Candidatus Tremblaya princeps]|uniref:Ribosomal RNA small subunit methyltransferase H n=1 Tax=Tremblaya princeps TaxID=189385 RepID=A0A143WNE6_TREPR|nr:Ribosomal RNA small subunit methyltransferase H [Candidatus Tremblaya princeps]
MLQEVVDNLLTDASGLYIDATYGTGGHSAALLSRLAPRGRVVALDCDTSVRFEHPRDPRAAAGHANYRLMEGFLRCASGADGIVVDLGTSSDQVHDARRGLSYLHPGPLDMRVDPMRCAPLHSHLRLSDLGALHASLRDHGFARHAKAIASRLLSLVRRHPTTLEVATAACQHAWGRSAYGRHPAADAFRALRSMANSEPQCLRELMRQAHALLKPNGRLILITFDSYGERVVRASIDRTVSLTLVRTVAPKAREVALNAGARSSLLHVLLRPGEQGAAAPPRAPSRAQRAPLASNAHTPICLPCSTIPPWLPQSWGRSI